MPAPTFEIPPDFPITRCPDSRQVDPTSLKMNPKTRKLTRAPIESKINDVDKTGTCFLLDKDWERFL